MTPTHIHDWQPMQQAFFSGGDLAGILYVCDELDCGCTKWVGQDIWPTPIYTPPGEPNVSIKPGLFRSWPELFQKCAVWFAVDAVIIAALIGMWRVL